MSARFSPACGRATGGLVGIFTARAGRSGISEASSIGSPVSGMRSTSGAVVAGASVVVGAVLVVVGTVVAASVVVGAAVVVVVAASVVVAAAVSSPPEQAARVSPATTS